MEGEGKLREFWGVSGGWREVWAALGWLVVAGCCAVGEAGAVWRLGVI